MTIILNPTTPGPEPEPTPVPVPTTGMTLTHAQNELTARGFDYLSTERQTIMLNDAKNQFEDYWEFPWLYAINTGTAPLAFTDLKYILTVKTAAGQELLGADLRVLAQDAAGLEQAGPPEYWYLTDDWDDANTTMRVWPTNPISVQVVYIRQSPELVSPDDRPLIPGRYHPVWIDLAVVQAYHDSDNFAGAQALQADINARMQHLILRYETRNRQHSVMNSVRVPSLDD